MKTFSINRTLALSIGAVAIVALFAFMVPAASAETGSGTPGGGVLGNFRDGLLNDNSRPYSVAAIRSCISAADLPSDTGTTTATIISKAKGDTLINCIKNARQRIVNNAAIEELLKKIEELRKQIQALKDSN